MSDPTPQPMPVASALPARPGKGRRARWRTRVLIALLFLPALYAVAVLVVALSGWLFVAVLIAEFRGHGGAADFGAPRPRARSRLGRLGRGAVAIFLIGFIVLSLVTAAVGVAGLILYYLGWAAGWEQVSALGAKLSPIVYYQLLVPLALGAIGGLVGWPLRAYLGRRAGPGPFDPEPSEIRKLRDAAGT